MKKAGCMSCGGSMGKKKMAMGGTSGKMPQLEGNNPRTPQGQRLKKGGSVSKSKPKFDLNKDGRTTFKDVLIGRGVFKKKMGGATKRK